MKGSKNRLHLCVTLVVINLLFIWGNSLMPGSVSKAFSSWVRELLSGILGPGTPGSDSGDGPLRKLAHVTEFTCLGMLLTWLISILRGKPYWVLAGGCLAALADEAIQYFVPGRNAALRDVCIDVAGVAIGLLLFLVLWAVCRLDKRRKA